jgi:type 1 glutamine amidotransferase
MKSRSKINLLTAVCVLMLPSLSAAEPTGEELIRQAKEMNKKARELQKEAKKLEYRGKVLKFAPQLEQALSEMTVQPVKKKRKLLVYSKTTGYRHSSIPYASMVFKKLGEATGAFSVDTSENQDVFRKGQIHDYDAILMLSTTGEPIPKGKGQEEFLKFIASGKGLVGIHAATDCHAKWKGYLDVMGGIFDGHPWGSGSVVTLYNEEPEHPCSHQVPHGYQIKDEIYQYKHDEHFTRDKLRILLSLDLKGPNMKKGGMKRKDKDYAVSWVRKSGPTRVFYTNLGHNESTFVDKVALQHMLSGIQYALGDIEADATPSAKLGKLPPNQ